MTRKQLASIMERLVEISASACRSHAPEVTARNVSRLASIIGELADAIATSPDPNHLERGGAEAVGERE